MERKRFEFFPDGMDLGRQLNEVKQGGQHPGSLFISWGISSLLQMSCVACTRFVLPVHSLCMLKLNHMLFYCLCRFCGAFVAETLFLRANRQYAAILKHSMCPSSARFISCWSQRTMMYNSMHSSWTK